VIDKILKLFTIDRLSSIEKYILRKLVANIDVYELKKLVEEQVDAIRSVNRDKPLSTWFYYRSDGRADLIKVRRLANQSPNVLIAKFELLQGATNKYVEGGIYACKGLLSELKSDVNLDLMVDFSDCKITFPVINSKELSRNIKLDFQLVEKLSQLEVTDREKLFLSAFDVVYKAVQADLNNKYWLPTDYRALQKNVSTASSEKAIMYGLSESYEVKICGTIFLVLAEIVEKYFVGVMFGRKGLYLITFELDNYKEVDSSLIKAVSDNWD